MALLFTLACVWAVCTSDDLSTSLASGLGGGLFVLVLILLGVL